ncbi:hypothetical protein C2E21_8712 [Chlorella sorokiniana]|uniref:Uncharacterized protein n=1 Tax=Chlorella sorokiniana TaxID=3076 RepID=A0A2P6TDI6_CHLSO|nr:hypothetical protein C2E21_8712 [Chlorella sorokiniana]|eukprot:PRW20716.1 hypothetical protein C2E21_8712 [Chlorella sorokiniana]
MHIEPLKPALLDYYQRRPKTFGRWDVGLLQCLEALLARGYRPRTFTRGQVARVKWMMRVREEEADEAYDPLLHDPDLQLGSTNRLLAQAIEQPAWYPENHRRFLSSFRASARTLLLAAHHGSSTEQSIAAQPSMGSGGSSADDDSGMVGLASLPHDLLLHILSMAVYPLSAWAPLDATAVEAFIDAVLAAMAAEAAAAESSTAEAAASQAEEQQAQADAEEEAG